MILLTGGAGYIGTHAALELLQSGQKVVVLDNFSNSSPEAVRRVRRLAGADFPVVTGDIRDRALLTRLFIDYPIDAVMHFAGLKAVGESVREPLRYYENNVGGSVVLFEVMQQAGVKTLVFSSSATVYGVPASVPIREDFPLSATNPYGASKLMIENILRDVAASDAAWRIALLRYFNPTGAHVSGDIGEDPQGIPNNLMPYVAKVSAGILPRLSVFGGDYATPDGTGVRDYIHVVDLVRGHLRALKYLREHPGVAAFNLGTGQGYSVLDMVHAFERVSGCRVPYDIIARRPGDVGSCYADPALARELLGWRAECGLEDMCRDLWRWQQQNPQGYNTIPVSEEN